MTSDPKNIFNDTIISRMMDSGRLYYDAGQAQLFRRHTTYALFFKQDLSNEKIFNEIINDALHYNGDLRDHTIIKMLDDIKPQEEKGKLYQVYGLYLKLANEVSRLPNGYTFLEAGRLAYEDYDKKDKARKEGIKNGNLHFSKEKNELNMAIYYDKIQWFKDTLKILKLDEQPHIKELISDWVNTGKFYVCGEENYQCKENGNFITKGTYTQLAKLLCAPDKPDVQVRNIIAYALGTKELFRNANDEPITLEEGLEKTRSHVKKGQQMLDLKHSIRDKKITFDKVEYQKNWVTSVSLLTQHQVDPNELYIARGNNIRKTDLESKVHQGFDGPPESITEEGKDFYRKVFSITPYSVLRVLELEKYRIVFTKDGDLSKTYPKEDLPGLTEENCNISRASVGLRLSRFNTVLFAVGSGRQIDIEKQAQTLVHESWHIAINSEKVQSNKHLKETISNLYKEIEGFYTNLPEETKKLLKEIKSENLQNNSLERILNFNSEYYTGYKRPEVDKKACDRELSEEICANILSLTNIEFKIGEKTGSNAFHPSDNPHFKPVWELANKVNTTMEQVEKFLSEKELVEKSASKASRLK